MQLQLPPTTAAAVAPLPECSELTVHGVTPFPIGNCAWPQQPPVPKQNSIQLLGPASGDFPGVVLTQSASGATTKSRPSSGDTTAGDPLALAPACATGSAALQAELSEAADYLDTIRYDSTVQ
jgi:hypothetical protein